MKRLDQLGVEPIASSVYSSCSDGAGRNALYQRRVLVEGAQRQAGGAFPCRRKGWLGKVRCRTTLDLGVASSFGVKRDTPMRRRLCCSASG